MYTFYFDRSNSNIVPCCRQIFKYLLRKIDQAELYVDRFGFHNSSVDSGPIALNLGHLDKQSEIFKGLLELEIENGREWKTVVNNAEAAAAVERIT